MNKQEKLAREMVERCVTVIDKNPKFNHWRYDRLFLIEEIFRELNLVALLEDKARLDWLLKESSEDTVDPNGINLCVGYEIKYKTSAQYANDVRTAITNAMKQEEGK